MADQNLLEEESRPRHLSNKKNFNMEITQEGSACRWSFRTIPKRYFITFLLFVVSVLEGYVLTNMSIVIIDITFDKKIIHGNETKIIKAEYNWTPMQKSLVLGISFLGQMLAALGGVAVHKIGGATYMKIGKLGEAIICIASPLIISIDVYLFIGARFLLGLFEGISYNGFTDVLVHWAPPSERVRLITLSTIGTILGMATNYPISGFVIRNFSWQILFYMTGGLLLVWSIIWILFVSNDPAEDRFISEKERNYLSRKIDYISKEKVKLPFKRILTSGPVYALVNEFFISGFTVSFCMLVPLYIKDVYDFDIQTLGLISGIPDYCAFITRPIFAFYIDYMRSKPNGYGVNKIHKVQLLLGDSLTAIFLILTAFLSSVVGCIICLSFVKIFLSLSVMSHNALPMDAAGQYAGFVQSMTQVARSITFFLNPVLIGLLIPKHTRSEWNVYFIVISFLTMYSISVFLIFGSGNLQPWAKVSKNDCEKRLKDKDSQIS